jgi:hypothetical protein
MAAQKKQLSLNANFIFDLAGEEDPVAILFRWVLRKVGPLGGPARRGGAAVASQWSKKGLASRKNKVARRRVWPHYVGNGFLCDAMIEPKFWWWGPARWECSRRSSWPGAGLRSS